MANCVNGFRTLMRLSLFLLTFGRQARIMDLLKEIQDELDKYRSLDKAHRHLKSIQHELDKSYAELHALEKQLEKEYKEYEKLEGKSIKGFFYKVLGSKEDQLEKERQEYLQLSLKYDELKESIKLMEFEVDVLKKKDKEHAKSLKRVEKLKKQREDYLLRTNSKESYRLRDLVSQIESTTRLRKDIEEADLVGENLLNHLNKMIHLLRRARNWGRWDMHGGNRGRMYKHQKYTNIDHAKQIAYKIQNLLKSFEREVRDVYSDFDRINVKFDLDRFSGFANIFFDNLISDWIVQQKIVNSLNNVKSVHDRVTRILQSMQVDNAKIEDKIERLTLEKERLLEGQ